MLYYQLRNSQSARAKSTIRMTCGIQLQKMLLGRTTNVNCRMAVARLKRNVGIEYSKEISSHDAGSIQCRPLMASLMVCHVKPGPVGRS